MPVFGPIQVQITPPPPKAVTRDIFLHALFARVALSNGETIEFQTRYNTNTDTIELDIPPKMLPILDQITGMQRGPNLQQFINWLIGSQQFNQSGEEETPALDKNFVPASNLDIWFGAVPTNVLDNRIALILPQVEASTVGYTFKAGPDFTGSLKISMMWIFIDGDNNNFDIQLKTTISGSDGSSPVSSINDVNISTFNLIEGDIRETVIFPQSDIVSPNDIISILLYRNYDGSPDPQSESIAIIGLKVELE